MYYIEALRGLMGRKTLPLLVSVLAFVGLLVATGDADARSSSKSKLEGVVEGNGALQPGYKVSLYASYVKGRPFKRLLGSDTTGGDGRFKIRYRLPPGLSRHQKPVLYILAEKDESMLASAIGKVSKNDGVVVNEHTTVAIGAAFAQFIDGKKITGNTYGMINAVKMAANMANPKTGALGEVLDNLPNAGDTSTRETFNTLANIVASCVADSENCDDLFDYATPVGGPAPTTVLQALSNMTKFPSNNVEDLFALAGNEVFTPALDDAPTSWLLFIKFTGGQYSDYNADNLISGPGQIAIDKRGYAWINDNYVPTFYPELPIQPNPDNPVEIACSGLRLLSFTPWGEPVSDTPYFGGGLSGAGFGITLDPRGKIWVGNFGFEAPACADGKVPADPTKKVPAPHDSVSAFRSNGNPISGSDGFTKGDIWWPQSTVSDKKGNIWVANCGNDTVTLIPRGRPSKAWNIALPDGLGSMDIYAPPPVDASDADGRPLLKPFAIAIDRKGRAWVTANAVGFDSAYNPEDSIGGLYRVSRKGEVEVIASPEDGLLSWPMGIAGDSKGNMWVSSSDAVNVPCVTPFSTDQGKEIGPALVYFPADSDDASEAQIFGQDPGNTGGLVIPWGNFVDGNDTVWVFNFGQTPFDILDDRTVWPDTALTHFCGADEGKCPANLQTGDPISPPTGYVTDALDRVTGGGVDPSGNIWILNNWKKRGPYNDTFNTNPGGNSFVIVPGAAGPIKTPLIGPPESFDTQKKELAYLGFLFFLPFFAWIL